MRYLSALDRKRWITAAVTLVLAFLSGYLMQNVFAAVPEPPVAVAVTVPVAPAAMETAALHRPPIMSDRVRETRAARKGDCNPKTELSEAGPGMVRVSLTAPCHLGKAVRVKIGDFDAEVMTNATGEWSARVPAFVSAVSVEVTIADKTYRDSMDVPAAESLQHVVLTWRGPQTFHIRARTVGDWPDEEGGNVIRLGDTGGPAFEAFSFPSSGGGVAGVVRLTVDASVTEENCGKPASVTAYQTGFSGGLRPTEIRYTMPTCDRVGETVRLQNLFRDMRLAAR